MFNFKQSQTVCKICNSRLSPIKPVKVNLGFGLGFIAFVFSAEISKLFGYAFIYSLIIGVVFGVLFVILFSYYIFKTTNFEIKD